MLLSLHPDAVLFVGDLSNGDIRIIKEIKKIPFPTAVILGNHDRGTDLNGSQLKAQLTLLGDKNVGWSYVNWQRPPISIIGARPCSAGGGYFLSQQMKSVYGEVTIAESTERIYTAAIDSPADTPLLILAHSGPTGLGSDASSLCGRDWKTPEIDWGDKDLELSIDLIQKARRLDLVVFGHMHHKLKRGNGIRTTFFYDSLRHTGYLNAACVPRRIKDSNGESLSHFSWVEFNNCNLSHVSHRWHRSDGTLAYKENLFNLI